jgi:plasmid stabilization system protein ParE
MVKKIKWTNTANKTFDETAIYLQDNFSTQAAENFANLVYDKIDLLVKGLTVGRKTQKAKTVFILRLNKHRSMFYRRHGTMLIIVDFWDSRQDPSKKPY